MKNNKLAAIVGAAAALSLSACAAGIRTGIDESIAPPEPIYVETLAIMPVTAESGSEGLRSDLGATLHETLMRRFPGVTILGPEEAGWRLSESPAANEYAGLLEDFDRTGVAGSSRLEQIAQALEADHFLQVRVAYREETFLDPLLFSYDEFREEERKQIILVARIWSDRGPGPVWEAVVRTSSETDDIFQEGEREVWELVEDLTENLAERMPVKGLAGG